jgi:hypothetical protein
MNVTTIKHPKNNVGPIRIPESQTYFVHILDEFGKPSNTIVFSKGNFIPVREPFLDNVAESLSAPKKPPIFSELQIHLDDSVRAIKQKILSEILLHKDQNAFSKKYSYEEMYLFGKSSRQTKYVRIGSKVETQVSTDEENDAENIEQEEVDRHINPYLLPLHKSLSNPHKYYVYENSLLLNYDKIEDNELYVCFAENLLEFVKQESPNREIETTNAEYMIQTYFPLLREERIYSLDELDKHKPALLKRTITQIRDSAITEKSVQLFYDVYNRTERNIQYTQRGIQKIRFAISPASTQKRRYLPLDLIFKQIHCSPQIPFIKYNPGMRMENLYRLYYDDTTADGRKIPILTHKQILKLSRELGRTNQVSLYVKPFAGEPGFHIHFEQTGEITVYGTHTKAMPMEEWDKTISSQLNTIFAEINRNVSKTGYEIPTFHSLSADNIRIVNIHYISKTLIKKMIEIASIDCIYSILTVNRPAGNDEPIIRYKRVENYTAMDAETAFITELYNESRHTGLTGNEMIDILTHRFGKTEEKAREMFISFFKTDAENNRTIADHPGFPMKIQLEKNILGYVLEFEVDGIDSVRYLEVLEVYIESIIKMTQEIDKKSDFGKHIREVCSSIKKTDQGQPEQPQYANVITTGMLPRMDVPKPVRNMQPVMIVGSVDDDIFRELGLVEDEPLPDEIEHDARGQPDNENTMVADNIKSDDLVDDDLENVTHPEKVSALFNELYRTHKPLLEQSISKVESLEKSPEKEESKEVVKEVEPIEEPTKIQEKPAKQEETAKQKEEDDESSPEGIFYDDDEDDNDSQDGGAPRKKDKKNVADPTGKAYRVTDATGENRNLSPSEIKPDGISLKQPNPFLQRLQSLDPALFLTKSQGKQYTTYSSACQPTSRHPIVLTDEEKERIDREHPGSYKHAVKYGTDPKNPNWYICPRFWCFLTNSPISEKDAREGKCGNIIPEDADVIPPGAYVYEFKGKEHTDTSGNYVEHYPGFLKEGKHPDGFCLPCCFKHWDNPVNKNRRAQCAQNPDEPSTNATNKEKERETENVQTENVQTENVQTENENQDTEETNRNENPKQNGEPELGPKKEKTKTPKPKAIKQPVVAQTQAKITQSELYVISLDTYPTPHTRWGYLPIPAQLFLNIDYKSVISPQNQAIVVENRPTLLRYGVEQTPKQSFLGLFADIYANRQNRPEVPTIAEFRKILANEITLDIFIQIHNSSLVSVFSKRGKLVNGEVDTTREFAKNAGLVEGDVQGSSGKDLSSKDYEKTEFAKRLNMENVSERRFFQNTVASYRNFISYITDPTETINHTYLWDMFTSDIPTLNKGGLNLVLFQINENDITDKIEYVCPTNRYSKNIHDTNKNSVLVLLHDNYYEPIYEYQYQKVAGKPIGILTQKTFKHSTINANVKRFLASIAKTSNRYCAPLPSLPRVYTFKEPISLHELIQEIYKHSYVPVAQIVNYRNKVIGVLVRISEKDDEKDGTEKKRSEDTKEVMLPCFPSSPSNDFKTPVELRTMNDESVWTDYVTTRDSLTEIYRTSNRVIPCLPRVKIMEDDLVVGILTATNQFVQIMPPLTQIIDDGIPVEKMANPNNADNELTTADTHDIIRTEKMQRIRLENQLYSAFRTTIRNMLNDPENHSIRKSILDSIESKTQFRKEKLVAIEKQLRTLVDSQIVFVDIDFELLRYMDDVNSCDDIRENREESQESSPPYCLVKVKDDGETELSIPKTNLLADPDKPRNPTTDNEQLYFMRMADELLRYNRVRMFMFDTKKYFNLVDVNYQINDHEYIITQSTLNSDTFADLVPFRSSKYVQNTNYDTAVPAIHQTYAENVVTLDEQYEQPIPEDTTNAECIQSIINIVGNVHSMWKKSFPNTSREFVFKKTVECSFGVMMTIFQSHTGVPHSIAQIKEKLWEGYSRLIQKDRMHLFRFIDIMNFQGKKKLMEAIIQKKMTFETRIFSEEYYLSDLDIWVLAHTYKLSIILFNPNQLKGFVSRKERAITPKMEWVICGGNTTEKYFFIRSNITAKDIQTSGIAQYHLVQPVIAINETKEFYRVFDRAISGDPEYKRNVWTIDQMLSEIQYVPKNK